MKARRALVPTGTVTERVFVAASTLALLLILTVSGLTACKPGIPTAAEAKAAGAPATAMIAAPAETRPVTSTSVPETTFTSTPAATSTRMLTETAPPTVTATVTPTPSSTPRPSVTPTRTITPTPAPSETPTITPTPTVTPIPTATVTPTRVVPTPTPVPPVLPSRISSVNGRFLLLNMHGMLFHDNLADIAEDAAYARWMGAGAIRTFATDNNTMKPWNGTVVGNRIADIAPALRNNGIKLIVALVNNHKAVPGEAPEATGWMDGYQQLLLPFYTSTWRGAYLTFVRDLISTVKARGARDVVFAWEVGNELHTPRDVGAVVPFLKDAIAEIRRLDPDTPILPGTMGAWHLDPWVPTSDIARWLYCEAPIDAYTLHAYDWVNWDHQGDMPISFDFDNILKPCPTGRSLPIIVEELGTSRQLSGVYSAAEEDKRLTQERNQIRFVLNYPNVIGIGAWSGESPKLRDRTFYDNFRGLTSYGPDASGGGSCYDPSPSLSPGVRCQLEQTLKNLPAKP